MGDSTLIQVGRISIHRNDFLTFTVSLIFSVFVLLYLFRFWFLVYAILFFASSWTLVSISSSRRILRSMVFGYFSGYVLSAVIGFFFLGVA